VVKKDRAAIAALGPELAKNPRFETEIAKVFSLLPKGEHLGRELAGFNSRTTKSIRGNDSTTIVASYQYRHADGWALVRMALVAVPDGVTLRWLNVAPLKRSLKEINAFELGGKSPIHYLILAFAILVPIFIITTFVSCWRMPRFRFKKLWLFLILFATGELFINWTTGGLGIKWLTVRLLGAGFLGGGEFAPVILKVSFPTGAVVFWVLRKMGYFRPITDQAAAEGAESPPRE
jgi:hypothetical protein